MPTDAGFVALIDAGDTDAVRAALAADPSLASARGEDGVSALLHARYRFDRELLDALLAADPEMDVFDAAALGHLDRLRERLEDSTQAQAIAADGFTALHLAAFFGKVEAARALLAAGASPHARSTNALANQPLHAAAAGRHIEVCRVLLGAGADVNDRERGDVTPLHQAAEHGDVEMSELFLSAGADPRAVLPDGRTPADLAVAGGHEDLARRLQPDGAGTWRT